MPFIEMKGNILNSTAEGLVNPVNCVGVPGAGLARQFYERWPAQVDEYKTFCREGWMRPGLVHDALLPGGQRILSIATKRHWRDPSELTDVAAGLEALAMYCQTIGIASVALPALGCGLGGLRKEDVGRLVQLKLHGIPCEFHLYGLTLEALHG